MKTRGLDLKEKVKTQRQALRFIGAKIRAVQRPGQWSGSTKAPEDEAREVLANMILSHVPMEGFNFRPKAIYMGHIIRRVLTADLDRKLVDDKDYCGNKRLELAGQVNETGEMAIDSQVINLSPQSCVNSFCHYFLRTNSSSSTQTSNVKLTCTCKKQTARRHLTSLGSFGQTHASRRVSSTPFPQEIG